MRHLVIALALISCSKKSDPPAPESAPPAPAPAPSTKTVSPSTEMSGLVGKLQFEAAHRPANGVTAEQVFAALDKANIHLVKQRQYAGFTVKAAYCAGGTTTAGTPVTVCEYATPDAAREGVAYMDQHTPGGKRAIKGSTVVNVGVTASPEIDQAIHVFEGLN